jgi:hypothetical protein
MSKNVIGCKDKWKCEIERGFRFTERVAVYSIWEWELYRKGKLIWESGPKRNRVVTEGLNHLLDVGFHGTAAIATWYVCPFNTDYNPLAGDVYATPGYTESEAYTEGTRQAFVETAAASGSLNNNANKAVFSINATTTLYGGALVSDSTKGDTVAAGAVLYCASNFGEGKSVENGDTFKVELTLSLTNL